MNKLKGEVYWHKETIPIEVEIKDMQIVVHVPEQYSQNLMQFIYFKGDLNTEVK